MTQIDETTQRFTVTDPKQFDGDPFEVAERACRQAEAVARVLVTAVEGAEAMARNAELSRNLMETRDDARAEQWEGSPQWSKFQTVLSEANGAATRLAQLSRAAGFNPKAPLPKE